MNKFKINVIALALGFTFSVGAMAHSMSKDDYQVRTAKAEADYAEAMERCNGLAGKAQSVCVDDAKTVESNAKADVKASMEISDAGVTSTQNSPLLHNPAQTCATNIQAFVATFRENFLQHANSESKL